MSHFFVHQLPAVDQAEIKRGLCPWCLVRLVEEDPSADASNDLCPECGDTFSGTLTIED